MKQRLFAIIIRNSHLNTYDFEIVRENHLVKQLIKECYCYVQLIDKRYSEADIFFTVFDSDYEDIGSYDGMLTICDEQTADEMGGDKLVWVKSKENDGYWVGVDYDDYFDWRTGGSAEVDGELEDVCNIRQLCL